MFETQYGGKRPRVATTILTKNNVEGLTRPDLQAYYEGTNNQNSVALAKEQRHTSVEQDREPRNRPTQIQ